MVKKKRSSWKGPYISSILYKNVKDIQKKPFVKKIKTRSRNSVIMPFFLGKHFLVYNGKSYVPIRINSEMIGHKLGEFVPTRLRHIYKKK